MINTAAAVGTFVVIAATAVAAIMQLRHLRAANQLHSLLMLSESEQKPEFERYMHFVRTGLAQRLEDAEYRAGLDVAGLVDRTDHPEMHVMAWFEQIGVLVKNGYLEEKIYLDAAAPVAAIFWDLLGPAIAVRRRRVGDSAFANFEYLAARSKQAIGSRRGSYPTHTPRLPLQDPWRETDGVPGRSTAHQRAGQ